MIKGIYTFADFLNESMGYTDIEEDKFYELFDKIVYVSNIKENSVNVRIFYYNEDGSPDMYLCDRMKEAREDFSETEKTFDFKKNSNDWIAAYKKSKTIESSKEQTDELFDTIYVKKDGKFEILCSGKPSKEAYSIKNHYLKKDLYKSGTIIVRKH